MWYVFMPALVHVQVTHEGAPYAVARIKLKENNSLTRHNSLGR